MNLISERFTRNSKNGKKNGPNGSVRVLSGKRTGNLCICMLRVHELRADRETACSGSLDRWIVRSPARQRIVNRIAVSSLDHSSSVRALCYCFSVLFLRRNEPPPCIDAAVNCYSMPLVIDFQSFPGPKLRCSHNYNSTLWSILHTTSCNWYYIYSGWPNYSRY